MPDPSELAESAVSAHGLPGLALGILDGDEVRTGAAGVVDTAGREALSADAVFRVASLTKPVVATLLVGLAADGLVGLDEPLAAQTHLPWVLDSSITLRHLLGHRSGLHPDLEEMERFGEGQDALEAAVAEVVAQRPRTAPGRSWWYANSGYWVAGAIAARVLGTTFEAAVADRVLDPLGMDSTSFVEQAGLQPVPGHVRRTGPPAAPPYPRARRPSGGLLSTVSDLLRFSAAVVRQDGPSVPQAAVEAMTRPRTITTWGTRYGLGWEVARSRGAAILSHDGDWGGSRARLVVVPARRFAFVALANATAAGEAIDELERALLGPLGLSRGWRVGRLAVTAVAWARDAAARARLSPRR